MKNIFVNKNYIIKINKGSCRIIVIQITIINIFPLASSTLTTPTPSSGKGRFFWGEHASTLGEA